MKGKYIVPLILASVSATTLGAQAHFSVKADSDITDTTVLEGDLIKISNFEGEGTVGDEITIPTAVVNDGVTAKVTVLDPRGKEVSLNAGGTAFVPTLKGYYTVKYSATKNGQLDTVTEELKVLVTGNEYSITLPKNSQYVIPATVKTNQKVQIPMPSVTENEIELTEAQKVTTANGEGLKVYVVAKGDASSSTQIAFNAETKTYDFTPTTAGVYEIIYRYYSGGYVQDYKTDSFVAKDSFNGSDIKLNFSYKSTRPTTATLGNETTLPQVKVFDTNNSSVELDAYVTIDVVHEATNTKFEVKDYKFTPTLKGKYRVTYKASIPMFGIESKPSTFLIEDVKDNVQPNFTVSNNYEYTTTDGKTTITRVYKDANKNNTFDSGEQELFNATQNTTLSAEELQEKIQTAMGSAVYDIPSVVVLKADGTGTNVATVKIPGFYATDNFSDYSKLTFTRTVKNSTGLITEIRKTVNDTRVPYAANEWAEYTFTTPGDYTIRYEVKDEAGQSFMDSYDIKVLASDAVLKEDDKYILPTLTFPAITSYAKDNAIVTINQPSASDKYDTRVETRVYYSFDKDTFNVANEITTLNDEGKLVLNLEKALEGVSGEDKIYIHAVAYNDYAMDGATRQYSKVTREISIIDTEDNGVPTFDNANQFFTKLAEKNLEAGTVIDQHGFVTVAGEKVPAFNQKDLVKLPDFVISDVKDTNLNITLTVKDPYGKTVTVKNSTYAKDVQYSAGAVVNNIYTVKNGTFTADYSGVYTITYTAKDAGGNIISKSYGIRVKDTEKPTIVLSSYDPFTSGVEVGKVVEVPAATLIDNGELLTEITTNVPYESREAGKAGTYWELVEGPSLNTMGTVGFIPSVAGDYVIKYYGWDKGGILTQTKSYTITATDTIKPTIKLEKDLILTNIAWDEAAGSVTVYAPGVVEIYDGKRDSKNPTNDFDQTSVNEISLVVKVYDKDNKLVEGVETVEVKTGEDAYGNDITTTRYKFVAEKQGVYKVTYITTDNAGNATELTQEVKVGDTDAPALEWVDSEKDLISTADINSSYEFNLDMITLDDIAGSEAIKVPSNDTQSPYTITVNMYDSSSSVVKNEYAGNSDKKNQYKWTFENSGDYELRITFKDKAGNSDVRSYRITVNANKTNTENKTNKVVGIVLIVVSAVILVGVVAYFVITGLKKNNTKKGPKAKNKK